MNLKHIILLFIFIVPPFLYSVEQKQNIWQYYFNRPASVWEESVPLGNGRLGMMPWGGVGQERIVLNEISLWSGNRQDSDNPDAYRYLKEIRELLFQKRNKEAQELMYRTFTCKGEGSDGIDYGCYQVFSNLYVDFMYPGYTANDTVSYRRTLDMNNALSTVDYTLGGIDYHREYFTSFTDDIGVVRYSSGTGAAINLKARLQRDEKFQTFAEGNILTISGQLGAGQGHEGMKYKGLVKIINKGGELITSAEEIEVKNADEVIMLISLATNYKNTEYEKSVQDILDKADTSYSSLKKKHIAKYNEFFNRADLTLGKNRNSGLPIDKRLEAFVKDNTDYDLSALYFQYGRYLLISSTRAGGLPPNLQGLWAPQIYTPWNGDYHLNINLQMNLWPAEVCNLSELHLPMIDYVKSLVEPGEKTAKTYYNSEGWVTHILGNVWDFTSPGQSPSWGATNTSGAWLCQHLWEHYLYTLDVDYLKSVYPVMKGATRFFEDMLVEDPESGYLVTAPTTSPENTYITSSNDTLSVSAGSTMDNQIIRELFTNVCASAEILGVDEQWRDVIAAKKEGLAPTSVGKHGQIMEWLEDYDEAEKHHRHVSQLYGLHPGYELTYEKTPELMEAAKVTLNRRGDKSTGWSMAWKINFWARLKDGNRAYKLISDLFRPAGKSRGTYPNLFSAHPPMQIDGNFGGCAGIAEMLLQSHAGYIEVLPSVPDEWHTGSVRGLRVRGGGEVSFSWKDGRVSNVEIMALVDNSFLLKVPHNISKDYPVRGDKNLIHLKKGEKITISYEN